MDAVMVLMLNGKELRGGDPAPPVTEQSHSSFLAFESIILMQMARERAIALHYRLDKLWTILLEKPEGVSIAKVSARIKDLESSQLRDMARFLECESTLDHCWQEMTQKDRKASGIAEMLGVEVDTPSVLNRWHSRLGESSQPDTSVPMSPTALRFRGVDQIRAYTTKQRT